MLDYKPPSGNTGSGGSADRMPDTIGKIIELEERAESLKKAYLEVYETAEQAKNSLKNLILRDVIDRRYFLYETFPEIAEHMNYTERHVKRLHGQALQKMSLNVTVDL